MNVLGINCSLHDISVALFIDGKLAMAVEEERFTKDKHQGGLFVGGSMPKNALRLIYQSFPDVKIDCFSYSGNVMLQPIFVQEQCEKMVAMAKQLDTGLEHTRFVDHHLCHALSAYAESGFAEASVLVVDGEGDGISTSIWKIDRNGFVPLLKLPSSCSIGHMYSYITRKLGFTHFGDEGKVMALSSYGTALKQYENLLVLKDYPYYEIDFLLLKQLGKHAQTCTTFEEKADVAKTLQTLTEKSLIWLSKLAVELSSCDNLCISGGVAYNCRSNYEVWKSGCVKDVFVPSMPGDAGLSIGAGVFAYYAENGTLPMFDISPYSGSSLQEKAVVETLSRNKIQYHISDDVCDEAAEILHHGNTVFWFNQQMEFGPRALGNRSILAPIGKPGIAKYINDNIKHREVWRPFAPAVMAEFASEFFENPVPSPYMSFAIEVKEKYRKMLSEVSSVDGTSRVQTVSQRDNPNFYRLLCKYKEKSGIPILLNTSFNDKNQPIVESLEDALNMFFTSCVEYLVVGNVIITKQKS